MNTVDDFVSGSHTVKLMGAIQREIDGYNEAKAENHIQRIQKFCVLPSVFTVDGGELGPTLKLKRHVVTVKYQEFIDQMYN